MTRSMLVVNCVCVWGGVGVCVCFVWCVLVVCVVWLLLLFVVCCEAWRNDYWEVLGDIYTGVGPTHPSCVCVSACLCVRVSVSV